MTNAHRHRATLELVSASGADGLLMPSSGLARKRFLYDGALHRLPDLLDRRVFDGAEVLNGGTEELSGASEHRVHFRSGRQESFGMDQRLAHPFRIRAGLGGDGPEICGAGGEKKENDLGPGPKPSAAETKAVAELAKAGITAREIAQGSNWRYIKLRVVGKKFDAKVWDQIKDVGNLIELNAAGVELTDADLAKVGKLTNLRRLNLANTAVKDASLAGLKGLANLEYLNLVGTPVTDAGVKQLTGLKKLQSVYLFESKVTDAGVAELKKALPNARIDNGADLKAFAAASAAKAEEAKKADDAKKDEKKPDAPKADEKKEEPKKKKKK